MSLQARAYDATNSGGRTPGSKLLASSPPLPRPDGGGNPWPCTCVHGPKKTHRPSRHLLRNNRHANHNRDIDHLVNVLQIRREAATVESRLSSHRPHLWNFRPAHRGRATTGCNCEISTVYPRLHLWKTCKQGHRPPNTNWGISMPNLSTP